MRLFGAVLGMSLAACYAGIPPPVDPAMLPACSAGSYGVLGTDACESDADCTTCTRDDEVTRAMSRSRRVGLDDVCVGTPTADVACCEHRCTIVTSGAIF